MASYSGRRGDDTNHRRVVLGPPVHIMVRPMCGRQNLPFSRQSRGTGGGCPRGLAAGRSWGGDSCARAVGLRRKRAKRRGDAVHALANRAVRKRSVLAHAGARWRRTGVASKHSVGRMSSSEWRTQPAASDRSRPFTVAEGCDSAAIQATISGLDRCYMSEAQ
jgi:hypothetical protein